jgi:2,4-dienoyl-CoA reductase-like NADH-dependent reductase (Old Yellow Enzyme family)
MTAKEIRLDTPLKLTEKIVIKNRFFKSAMSEALGEEDHGPSKGLSRLYGIWANGGVGLAITGNVMIDHRALGEPKNVVVEGDRHLDDLKAWAKAGTQNHTHLWMQINHPGKQIPKFLNKEPVAPSAIPLGGGLEHVFNTPRALTEEEIFEIINRYATTAAVAKNSGFTGVQIHGAHGYLVSQFLSPKHNNRDDQWGGTAEKRMRFALEVYRAIRKEVGEEYPVGIKLNSADFQRGGFTEEESMQVVKELAKEGVNLIEISGGTYESPAMTGINIKESTRKREAYFLEYAEKVRKEVETPLVVTGGFRSGNAMLNAINSGATDMVGLARPLAVYPTLPNDIMRNNDYKLILNRPTTGIALLDKISMLDITWYEQQLSLLASGKPTKPNLSGLLSALNTFYKLGRTAFKKRRA